MDKAFKGASLIHVVTLLVVFSKSVLHKYVIRHNVYFINPCTFTEDKQVLHEVGQKM